MKQLLATSILALLTTLLVSAEPRTHILFSADADVNGDGVTERLMIGSQESADPTAFSAKEFIICENQGGRYNVVFRKDLGTSPFSTDLITSQWASPESYLPGISVRDHKNGIAPEITVVFTSGTEDFLTFQYIREQYREIVEDETP